jgi:multiple sugar transport system permease protein
MLSGWQFGSSMLIFLAGLKNIPDIYYEAAEIDGANRWQRFWVVTIPFISPVLIFNLIMTLINSFMIFTQAYIVTEGGPMDSTLFLILYVFRKAFQHFYMGYASALSWIVLVILGLFVAAIFRFTRKWIYYAA